MKRRKLAMLMAIVMSVTSISSETLVLAENMDGFVNADMVGEFTEEDVIEPSAAESVDKNVLEKQVTGESVSDISEADKTPRATTIGEASVSVVPTINDITEENPITDNSASEDQTSSVTDQNSVAEDQTSGASDQNSGTEDRTSGASDQNSGTEDQTSGTTDQNSSVENQISDSEDLNIRNTDKNQNTENTDNETSDLDNPEVSDTNPENPSSEKTVPDTSETADIIPETPSPEDTESEENIADGFVAEDFFGEDQVENPGNNVEFEDENGTNISEDENGSEEKAALSAIEINENTFPDNNFRNYILSTFDTDKDEILSPDELEKITEINVEELNISDLAGIGFFINLESLNCSKNQLHKLNLEDNPKLLEVYCSENELEELKFGKQNLQVLHCEKNHLPALDLGNVHIAEQNIKTQDSPVLFSPQIVKIEAKKVDDTQWSIDFGSCVGKENIDRISNLQFSEEVQNTGIDADGILLISAENENTANFSYDYLIGYEENDFTMEVNAEIVWNTELEENGETDDLREVSYSTDDLTCGDYKYRLDGDKATITGYTGNASTLVIPDTLDEYAVNCIGNGAFRGDETLIEVSVSAGVERIGSEAFGDCKNLKKITLSEGLKEIGYSFIKNTAVTSLIVPGTVENVNSYFYGGEIRGATDGALQLEEVIFEAGIKKIPGCFCSNSQLNNALVRVGIPESVEEVGDYAFYNCAGMEEINLVKGIGKIGYYAFYNCKSLKKIEFKKNEKLVTGSDGKKYLYPVTVESSAFSGCISLKEVVLSENVVELGSEVFLNCEELETVIMPDGLKTIGYSFIKNTAVKSLTIPSTVETVNAYYYSGERKGATDGALQLEEVVFEAGIKKIPDYFCSNNQWNDALVRVGIPEGVEEIGSNAFYNCTGIEEINLVKEIGKIGYSAFSNCKSLKRIEFQKNEKQVIGTDGKKILYPVKIEAYAFYGCVSLKEVVLSENVVELGNQVFEECTELETITMPEGLKIIGYSFIKNTAVRSLTVPNTVETVNAYYYSGERKGATDGALQLEEVIFEAGIKKIPDYFCSNNQWNDALVRVGIPEGVEEIGSNAFYNCTGIEEINLVKEIGKIGYSAFSNCKSLKRIEFQKNEKQVIGTDGKKILYPVKIEAYAFYGCVSLKEVVLSENVVELGNQVFEECTELETVTMPEGLKTIGYSFIKNTAVKSLTVPNTVETVNAYYYSGERKGATDGALQLEEVVFEAGIKKIPDYFCSNTQENDALVRVELPESVEEIGSNAFYNCTGLEEINLVKEIGKIGNSAFSNCRSLKRIEFQKNEKQVIGTDGKKTLYPVKVEAYAFYGCISLKEVVLSENVVELGNGVFEGCTELETVTMPEGLKTIGHSFIKNTAVKKLIVPNTVENVNAYYYSGERSGATNGALQLEEVVFEAGIKKIPDYFCSNTQGNDALVRAGIPESVEEIGSNAFYNCTGLEEINFVKGIGKIGDSAFSNCKSLKRVEFQKNEKLVTGTDGKKILYPVKIDSSAFYGCSSLKEVILSENIVELGSTAFMDCVELGSLTIPEGLKTIGYSFIKNTAIKELTVPKTIEHISAAHYQDGTIKGATDGAYHLKQLIFSEGTTSIPSYFCCNDSKTAALQKVVIPPSVTSIGEYAFYHCTDFIIYGEKGSYAETYASENGIPFCEIKYGQVTRYDTAKKILDKFPIYGLVNNIQLKNGTIKGPEITVLGKTFNLFEINAGMDLPISDKVQAKVDLDTKTVQVLIGFKDFSGSASLDKETNSTSYWSESYRQVKNIYTGMTGKKVDSTKLWNDFSKLRGKLKKFNMTMAIDANAYAAGYMEFSYASGNFEFQEGGIILEAGLGTEITRPFVSFPAAYCTLKLESDFNGNMQLVKNTELNYSLSLAAQLELAARLGVGLGVKKAGTYVEGGLFGSLATQINLPATSLEEALTVLLNGGLYLDSKILGYDGFSKEERYLGVQLYPQEAAVQAFDGMDILDLDEINADSTDRTYLSFADRETILAGNTQIQGAVFEKNGAYPYSSPQLARLNDGSRIMVWIDDDGTKDDVNKTSLFASVFKDGEWSEAEVLYETGGLNDYPDLYTDGENVYIVWQRTASALSRKATLSDAMKATNLYCITYSNGEFSQPELIGNSTNTTYEMMQKVTSDGENTAVIWVENSENDPFMADGSNSVKIASKDKDSWEEKVVAQGIAPVSGVDLGYVNGSLAAVYETYSDDNNVIHLDYNGRKKEFSGSNSTIAEGILYYTLSGKLYAYDIIADALQDNVFANLDNFTIVNGSNIKYLLTLQSNGQTNEIYASVYDDISKTWGSPVAVTDYGKYIRSYTAQVDESGNLTIAINAVDVDETSGKFTNEASICVINTDSVKDIALSGVTYDDSLVKPGQKLPLNFVVTNNSLSSVEKFKITLTDQNGKKISSGEISSHIEPGASEEASYLYQLPENLTLHTVNVSVEAEGEVNKEDNSEKVTIGYGNLVLGGLHLTGNEKKPFVSGVLSNTGYDSMENIEVSVYEKNATGKLLGTVKINELGAGKQNEFSVEIPAELLNVNIGAIGNVVYVNAETDSMESNLADNSDYLLIDGELTEEISLNYSTLELFAGNKASLKVAYTGNTDISDADIIWSSSDTSVATVNAGEVTAISGGTVVITATIGNASAKCTVTVTDSIAVSSITLEKQSVRIFEGELFTLEATILPENATNKNISWSSSEEKIATVDENGTVTGITAGTAVITATASDGTKQASCTVLVTKDKTLEYVADFQSGGGTGEAPEKIRVTGGTKITLPENTFEKTGYLFAGWNDGDNVYPAKAVYRMPYENITFTAQWNRIEPKKVRRINVERDIQKKEGDSVFNLNAVLSKGTGELLYSSEDSVLQVDEEGNVTVLAVGTATITILSPETEEYKEARTYVEVTIAHAWGDWKRITDASGEEKEMRECLVCKETEYRDVQETEPTLIPVSPTPTGMPVPEPTKEPSVTGSPEPIPSQTPSGSGTPTPVPTKVPLKPGTSTPTPTKTPSGAGTPTPAPTKTPSEPGTPTPAPSKTPSVKVTPTPTAAVVLKKGKTFKVGTSKYKVTGNKTVAYTGTTNAKATKISIGTKVTYKGVTYKITSVMTKAFRNHKKVQQIIVGNNVTIIGGFAFEGCKALKKVTIGSKVTSIGSGAFKNCKKLSSVTIKSKKLKKAGSNAFKGIYAKAKIKVPASKLKTYKKLLKNKGLGSKAQIIK